MHPDLANATAWLSREDLQDARERLPILYVHAVPVRVDDRGRALAVGLLLRADSEGRINRELVGGRVRYHERIRDALVRHLETDLGSMALPRVPVSPMPFTVAEWFPTPGVTPYVDPRQHAVSLCYIVSVTGDASPQADSLDLAWCTPEEALRPEVLSALAPGHDALLRQALAHLGHLS